MRRERAVRSARAGTICALIRARAGTIGALTLALAAASGATPAHAVEATPTPAPAGAPQLAIDAARLAGQPEAIARALRANVVIERAQSGDQPAMVAAGVILRLHDGTATIVTAQHVVDPRFRGSPRATASPETLPAITVTSIGGVRAPAKVEWRAPHGVDLAIVSARLPDAEARTAVRAGDAPLPTPGERVFTIGNPQGGYWTRVDGTVKQQREARQDGIGVTLLWSDLVVQPGFSGGGLFDAQGRLIAIDSTRGAISSGAQGRALLLATALRALEELAPADTGR